MESFSSASAYLQALEARSGLPDGFRSSTVGIRFSPRERKVDTLLSMNLSLILLEKETRDFGAVFTRNRFPGAPVLIGKERLGRATTRGVLINNKISNVCTHGGKEDAEKILENLGGALGGALSGALSGALGGALGGRGEDFFIASTGIIGWKLPLEEMSKALPGLVDGLGPGSILPVARAIMTTDSFPKVRRASVGSGIILGIAKGAGMIEPNMATLLCFLLTDVKVERERLRDDLAWCVERSLNRISVDGDQSTSDTALLFSSGTRAADPEEFRKGLLEVLSGLSVDIVRNAEGAGHVVRVRVGGARDEKTALGIGKAIANSPLVKTAIFGNDPNVGHIVCSLGDYLGNEDIPMDTSAVVVRLGGVEIFTAGEFTLDAEKEEKLSSYLTHSGFDPRIKGYPQHDRIVEMEIALGGPSDYVEILGTDLSYEYVRENADYRS